MSLTAEGAGAFEHALRDLLAATQSDSPAAAIALRDAFDQLARSELAHQERSRRAQRITELLVADSRMSAALVSAARSAASEVRSGVLSALTPDLRAALYDAIAAGEDVAIPESLPSREEAAHAGEGSGSGSGVARGPAAPGEWKTVLLLGEAQEVEPNERFLEEHDYRAIRVADEHELETLVDESYCAVVIHSGFWSSVPDGREFRDVLADQFDRASVPVYRIDSSVFKDCADEVVALLDALGPSVRSRVTLASGATLNATDLADIDRYAQLLESGVGASITVEALTERETRLLTTAASLFAAKLRSQPVPTRALDLSVTPLTEGRSGARVLRVLARGVDTAFVAKIDAGTALAAELVMARLVMPANQQVDMEIYALGGVAVLLQRLVVDADQPLQGAPSFKERLEARSAWERGRNRDPEPIASDLSQGIARLLRTLKTIASTDANGTASRCWMRVEPLEALARQGVVWSIESNVGQFDPREVLPVVEGLLASASGSRLVHGDLHAGNVLMADDRTPLLIDFANAGAGHPLFDLVRFSSAVAFFALRAVVPEARLRELFVRLFIGGAGPDDLSGEFPDVVVGGSSVLAVECLCGAREAALALMDEDGGKQQYLALMYLVAAQSLTMHEFQSATVRAALGAIQPEFTGAAA